MSTKQVWHHIFKNVTTIFVLNFEYYIKQVEHVGMGIYIVKGMVQTQLH